MMGLDRRNWREPYSEEELKDMAKAAELSQLRQRVAELVEERDAALKKAELPMKYKRMAFNAELQEEITTLKSALRSIANNTCCGDCQEARLVAITALGEEK